MVNFCHEAHFGRFEWIIVWNFDIDIIYAAYYQLMYVEVDLRRES
jgi:hypothetical protein